MAFAHGYPMADLMRMREAMSRLSHPTGAGRWGRGRLGQAT